MKNFGRTVLERVHPESLLRIPLVARAFSDPHVRALPRAIDCQWYYEGVAKISVVGFNPFGGKVYYGAKSQLAAWSRYPERSSRPHNHRDRLVHEVLFYVHDYLHTWACRAIQLLRPGLGLGHGQIGDDNFEDLVFAWLLTEAVATVGLDYWYLATVWLPDVIPIGTHRTSLAVSYHESLLEEYRRARSTLTVQAPEFFVELAEFYCTGVMKGFDTRDLRRSPVLERWLAHEVIYGHTQRVIAREWLAYLAGRELPVRGHGRPVRCRQRWQRDLMCDVGAALWQLVKHGRDLPLPPLDDARAWRSPARSQIDPRFINLNRASRAEIDALENTRFDRRAFEVLVDQHLGQLDYQRFDRDKLAVLSLIREKRDLRALRALTRGERRIRAAADEPRDLLLLN